jgi:transcriptional regulator with XRE-family HTH domain
MHPTPTVGQTIRAKRAKKRMRLADLSSLCGLTPSALSRIECGERMPSMKALERIAKGLGVSTRDLLPPRAA